MSLQIIYLHNFMPFFPVYPIETKTTSRKHLWLESRESLNHLICVDQVMHYSRASPLGSYAPTKHLNMVTHVSFRIQLILKNRRVAIAQRQGLTRLQVSQTWHGKMEFGELPNCSFRDTLLFRRRELTG